MKNNTSFIYKCRQKNPVIIFIISSTFLFNFRCQKDEMRPFDQEFEIPLSISPLKKTYSITDTIWLEAEVTGKQLRDRKVNAEVLSDTGKLFFTASYYGFGTGLSKPAGGFCDVITSNGVNTNRRLEEWSSVASIDIDGCTQTSYRFKIGFKLNHKGTYSLLLPKDLLFFSCPNKLVPYHASSSYKFTASDLNADVFNELANKENFGKDAKNHYTEKLSNKELFVFRVE